MKMNWKMDLMFAILGAIGAFLIAVVTGHPVVSTAGYCLAALPVSFVICRMI